MHHINPVGEQIGHLPAAEIEIRAEVVVLLRVPIAPLHRPEKSSPIQIGWTRLEAGRGFAKVVSIAVPPRASERDPAELARLDDLLFRLQVELAGTLLHSNLANAIV